jgi:hypothetical protein
VRHIIVVGQLDYSEVVVEHAARVMVRDALVDAVASRRSRRW